MIPPEGLRFSVYFSGNPERGNFRENGLGFFRQGEMDIYPDRLEFTGRTHWPLAYRILVLIVLEAAALLMGLLIGGLGLLLIERYLLMTGHSAVVPRSTVRNLEVRRRIIRFEATASDKYEPSSVSFLARNESEAEQIRAAFFEPVLDTTYVPKTAPGNFTDLGWG